MSRDAQIVWTIGGLAAVFMLTLWLWPNGREQQAPSSRKLDIKQEQTPDPRVAALAREIRRIERRLEDQQRNAPAPSMDKSATTKTSPDAGVPKPARPQLTPEERHARRVDYYSSLLVSEGRDYQLAEEFEQKLNSTFENIEHSSLQSVDCRSTLCKIEIRHQTAGARRHLDELILRGPMKHGSFDYVTEDGMGTVMFAGLPGHPLPIDDLSLGLAADDG